MTETGQMERTLAVTRGGKDELTKLLNDANISIILEKSIALTVADAKDLNTKNSELRTSLGSKPALGYILEADDVVQKWLDIIKQHDETVEKAKKRYLYGSPSQTVAEQDIAWLRRLTIKQKKPASGSGSKLPTPSTAARKTSSATTTKKTAGSTTGTGETRRTTTSQQTRLTQRPTSANGRVKVPVKQTQKTIVKDTSKAGIPRRSQKDSKPTAITQQQKKPTGTRRPVAKSVKNDDDNNNDTLVTAPDVSTTECNTGSSNASGKSSSVSTAGLSEEQEASTTESITEEVKKEDELLSNDKQPDVPETAVSVTSSASQRSGDSQPSNAINEQREAVEDAESEHDAEVAAATNHTSNIPTTVTDQSILRSSLSPNSVTSLPRPETPEVDQLRQRFESFAQVGASNSANQNQQQQQHRKSLSPETALKIKDTRPKTPGGKHVKNMVNFFMDENLHKWEF
ncbi:hypothetical protein BDA99DRAFT_498225 [Phascolomyces articulosus]|uniref:Uncharacterized protein n=1 Tax=Phascolomyces articulosus TaxID=60185 RepID=A0AAD5K968_9FUNG|nr:hypothetical protein BDA99DRAFT_498225 [Phascolomyces articulosus]